MSATAQSVPLPRPFALGPRAGRFALRIGTGAALLALWEGFVTLFAPSYVARPSGVARVLPDVLSSSLFWSDARVTVVAVFEGLAIGVVLGVVVGLTMGRLRDVDSALRFYVSAFFAMPLIALVPVMTLWFGYTGTVRLAIVSFGAFLPVCLNVYDGTRKLPAHYVEVAQSYHARWWNVWFGIALPASLPYLLAGFRLAAGRALVAAVIAEYIVALPGLGYFIIFDSRTFHMNEAMVAVLALALLGVAINSLADLLTRRFLPWYRRA
ncbi:MAG TPA: ABC transporter permease subunit [Gaiellaceae bacterium]|nr:ABC transporter permease subunit [Gaiellaceae bacterium]